MIQQFLEAGELFTRILCEERRIAAKATDCSAESMADRLLAMQHDRYGARNELSRLAKRVAVEVRQRGGDPMHVTRAISAAWHYVDRWGDVWFETRSHLAAMAIFDDEENHVKTRKSDLPKAPANQRMIDAVDDDPRRKDWRAGDWAEFLGVSRDHVYDLPFWASLQAAKTGDRVRRSKSIRGV